MKRFRPRLSYANVVATLALFLALAGGTVWAANKINGKSIKKNTIPGNRIKKNTLTAKQIKKQTITNNQIKPGSIQRTSLAPGSVPGVIIASASATSLPGATTDTPPGPTPVAFSGTTTFTAVAGKGYNVMAELVGNPVQGEPPKTCEPFVEIYNNGVPLFFLINEARTADPGFDARFPTSSFTANLLAASGPQSISAKVFGDPRCASNTSLDSLRIAVTEFG